MQPEKRDAAYLWDMLEAAKEVVSITAGMRYGQFLSDRLRQLAVERLVEIVGEAARHVSDEFKIAHGEIPWRKIMAQRRVLAHEYGDIEQERMWLVATIHAVELIAQLEPLLPPIPPQPAE